MIVRVTLVLFVLAASNLASAQPVGLLRGLDVEVRPLPEIERVGGVPVRIVVYAGRDATRLLQRWSKYWHLDPSTLWLNAQEVGPWSLVARVTSRGHEVIQTRSEARSTELYWSLLSSAGPTRTARTPREVLANECRNGPEVEGHDAAGYFRQATQWCRTAPQRLLKRELRKSKPTRRERRISVIPVQVAPNQFASALVSVERRAGAGR